MKDKQYFDQHVFVCTNQRPDNHEKGCCFSKGSQELINKLKKKAKLLNSNKKIRINKSGCLGRCSEGPVAVVYPDMQWFTHIATDDVDEVIETLKQK